MARSHPMILALWYGGWSLIGVLATTPGLLGLIFSLGGGAAIFLLMLAFSERQIRDDHIAGAFFVSVLAYGVASFVGVWSLTGSA